MFSYCQSIDFPLRYPEDWYFPFFKMKNTGIFGFSIGLINGQLKVIEYDQANYRVITSDEAAGMIASGQPVILDVRTNREYRNGHIKDSILIPVQELQSRLKELSSYKDQDILIYCATGNRSTVASKILIENGLI